MLSSSEIKFIKSLEMKKKREEHKLFVVEGEKIVNELLLSDLSIVEVFHTSDFELIECEVKSRLISNSQLERVSSLKNPNKVLAIVEIPDNKLDTRVFDNSNNLFLGLDNIKDPGNLGTILRTANWFGVKQVFCSEECVDCYNPKVVQASMGAIFRVKIIYDDLQSVIKRLKKELNITVYSTELSGTSLYSAPLSNNACILLGSESHGISPNLSTMSDSKLLIPSWPPSSTNMESLNVGVAAGILCAEFRKRIG